MDDRRLAISWWDTSHLPSSVGARESLRDVHPYQFFESWLMIHDRDSYGEYATQFACLFPIYQKIRAALLCDIADIEVVEVNGTGNWRRHAYDIQDELKQFEMHDLSMSKRNIVMLKLVAQEIRSILRGDP